VFLSLKESCFIKKNSKWEHGFATAWQGKATQLKLNKISIEI
jgi:hypothetical protein